MSCKVLTFQTTEDFGLGSSLGSIACNRVSRTRSSQIQSEHSLTSPLCSSDVHFAERSTRHTTLDFEDGEKALPLSQLTSLIVGGSDARLHEKDQINEEVRRCQQACEPGVLTCSQQFDDDNYTSGNGRNRRRSYVVHTAEADSILDRSNIMEGGIESSTESTQGKADLLKHQDGNERASLAARQNAIRAQLELLETSLCKPRQRKSTNPAALFYSDELPEKLSSIEPPSDGELSFAGVLHGSGTTTPPGELSVNCRVLALDLANRILEDFSQSQARLAKRYSEHAPAESSGSSSASSSPSHSTRSKDTNITVPSTRKRRLEKIDEDDENEDCGAVITKRRCIQEDTAKLFACPFAKQDPERYSERNVSEREYRSCSSCLLRDIPRLKQHLYRIHKRPEHYCPSCFEAFKTQALLDYHVRQRNCDLRDALYTEKMTMDQMKDIKRRHRGETPYQNWFSIFKVLFPEATLPSSPYAGEGGKEALDHFVRYFRTYGPEHFFNLMRDRQGTVQRLDASTQAIVDEAFEITAPELMRQLDLQTTDESTATSPVDVRSAAVAAHESINNLWQQEESAIAMPRRLSFAEPQHQSGLGISSEVMNASQGYLSQGFFTDIDFDATFDPLTIEDAFEPYEYWST